MLTVRAAQHDREHQEKPCEHTVTKLLHWPELANSISSRFIHLAGFGSMVDDPEVIPFWSYFLLANDPGAITASSPSGSGSGIATAPDRRCGLGFSGVRTGVSGSPEAGGSPLGSGIARATPLV
jgi:hypothetical protein